TVMDQDLKESALKVGKALNDPINKMGELAEVGIMFTDQQKEMITTLQESGDMVGAQKIILETLSGVFGGAASAAANTFSGRMTQMKNRIGDVWETIGEALIPALDALAPVAEGAVTVFENLAASLGPFIEQLVASSDEITNGLGSTFKWLAEN